MAEKDEKGPEFLPGFPTVDQFTQGCENIFIWHTFLVIFGSENINRGSESTIEFRIRTNT